jgi:WD40 repeat protein
MVHHRSGRNYNYSGASKQEFVEVDLFSPKSDLKTIKYGVSIDFGKDDRSLYIGTLGGYIMNYDFRLNSVIGSYKYNDNTPIIGLQTYMQCKGKEYDLFSTNLNPNFNDYLLIWTASNDHELGLWNLNTLNCDVKAGVS